MVDVAFCTGCGAQLSGESFCTHCGAATNTAPVGEETRPRTAAAPHPAPTVAPPVVPPLSWSPGPPPQKGVMPLVVGVIAGVVLLAAGGVGALLIAHKNGSDTTTAAPSAGSSTAAGGSTPTASAAATASAQAQPQDQASPATSSVTCWDHNSASSYRTCAPVTGVAGLKWVFPSLAATWSRCRPTPLDVKGETRIAAYRCGIDVSGGSAVLIYSEYQSSAAAESSYASRYQGVAPTPHGDRSEYGPARVAPKGDQAFYATAVYADADKWAVTAAAPNARLASAALATVRMRSHTDVARYE